MISVTNRTGDRKLSETGNMAATWVPQVSCHDDCPLKKNGCYAEVGRAGLHTHRLNKIVKIKKMGREAMRRILAKMEAKAIDQLPGDRKLRVHVVGDCATAEAAGLVGAAMVRYERKRGFAAYGYTHSWRQLLYTAWKRARILASVERIEDVHQARARGYQVALIVPPHPTNKVYRYQGLNVIPCPAQFFEVNGRILSGCQKAKGEQGRRLTTCEHCSICMRPDVLKERDLVVGFEPDGHSEKRVMRLIT